MLGVGSKAVTPGDVNGPFNVVGTMVIVDDNSGGGGTTGMTWTWQTIYKDGIFVCYPQNTQDGTAIRQQGSLMGGPDAFTVTGWRYFHD